ncbi:MAG TPA: 50S ribosomal protein L17 [bacterium (Candidatus Stahlbacteria)]|nr:50S ribosomal protein L17 [Candidatus Stahlbacteria bacterium]
MRHNRKIKKLGRKKAHRVATIRNLLRSLIIYGKTKTTITKAKVLRDHANRLISRSLKDNLATRRYLFRHLNDQRLVKKLCVEIAPPLSDYKGGFVRISRLGRRDGDGCEMALISLVETRVKEEKKGKKKKDKPKAKKKEKKGKEKDKGKKRTGKGKAK